MRVSGQVAQPPPPNAELDLHPEEGLEVLISPVLLQERPGPAPRHPGTVLQQRFCVSTHTQLGQPLMQQLVGGWSSGGGGDRVPRGPHPGREDLGCPVPAAPAWDPTSTWFFQTLCGLHGLGSCEEGCRLQEAFGTSPSWTAATKDADKHMSL